jgi:hypothetical protein
MISPLPLPTQTYIMLEGHQEHPLHSLVECKFCSTSSASQYYWRMFLFGSFIDMITTYYHAHP